MTSLDFESGITFARQLGLLPVVLVVDISATPEKIKDLLRREEILAAVPAPALNQEPNPVFSIAKQYQAWRIPLQPFTRQVRSLLVIGPRENIGLQTLLTARARGIRTVICWDLFNWVHKDVTTLTLERICNKAKLAFWTRLWAPSVVWVEKHARRKPPQLDPKDSCSPLYTTDLADWCIRLEDKLIGRAARTCLETAKRPLLPLNAFSESRIMLFNTSLSAGGAERQVVNTLLGLVGRGYHDVLFRAGRLEPRESFGFFFAAIAVCCG